MDTQRLPIDNIGDFKIGPGGIGLLAPLWTFHAAPGTPQGGVATVSDANAAGWTAYELHTIAHGAPCDCEAASAIDAQRESIGQLPVGTTELRRLPISEVGKFDIAPGGVGIVAHHWTLGSDWLPMGTEIPVLENSVGGWPALELHAIAHGAPCECDVKRAIDLGRGTPPTP